MRRSFRNNLILITAVLLLLTACVLPQNLSGQTVRPTQGGLDLWTAPPETGTPVSLSTDAATASTSEPALPTGVPASDTPVPVTPSPTPDSTPSPALAETSAPIDEYGTYTSKEDVALYLYTYGHLPSNFITKKEAQALGWPGGDLRPYAPGKCIGGDYFGNYEKLLPAKKGRTYYECDIDTLNRRSRGSKRIVWSNDGLIYYTDDHFGSFTLLYGGE